EVVTCGLVLADAQALPIHALEARDLDADGVGAGLNGAEEVAALGVGDEGTGGLGGFVDETHRGTRNRCAGRVVDRAAQAARTLGERRGGRQQDDKSEGEVAETSIPHVARTSLRDPKHLGGPTMFNKLSFSRPTRAPTNLADRRNYQDACVRIFVQVVIRCQESFIVGHMKYHEGVT